MRARNWIVAALIAWMLVPGCTCGSVLDGKTSRELRKRPALRVAAEAQAPAGCRWKSASVEIAMSHEIHVGGKVPAPATMWRITQTLLLKGGDKDASLVLWNNGGTLGTDEDLLRADMKFALAFAPDGKSLGLSDDGGTSWTVVALDSPDALPWCPHEKLPSFPAGPLDAPARRFCLTVCGGHSGEPSTDEWAAVACHVSHHAADAELQLAFAAGAGRRGTTFPFGTIPKADLEPLQKIAREQKPVGDAWRAALAEADGGWSRPPMVAALMLEGCDDEATQVALAGALARSIEGRAKAADPHSMHQPTLSRVLARITERRRKAQPAVVDLLIRLLDESGDSHTTLYALRALVAVDSPRAKAAVDALAAESKGEALPPWPETFDGFYHQVHEEHLGMSFPPRAFAKAARVR